MGLADFKGLITIVDSMDMAQPKKIAIYEDTQTQADFLQSAARETGCNVYMFNEETAFYNHFISINPDLIIFRSESLNTVSRILNTLLSVNFKHPVLIFSDNTHMDDLVSITRIHTAKVLVPPSKPEDMKTIITDVIHSSPTSSDSGHPVPVIVGDTPEIIRIKKKIAELGKNDDAILIQGEKGTGRELLAKSIHLASDKMKMRLLASILPTTFPKTSRQQVLTWGK